MSSKAQEVTGNIPTLVFASNYDEYALWCRNNGMRPNTNNTHFMSCPEMMYGWGRVNIEIICIPLWWTDEDQIKLEEMMEYSK